MNVEEVLQRKENLLQRFDEDGVYERVGEAELDLLGDCLGIEFYRHARAGNMVFSLAEESDAAISNGRVNAAALRVDGPYFRDREAVTFESNGQAHLCGWADSNNMQPFLNGFERWMDIIEESGKETAR